MKQKLEEILNHTNELRNKNYKYDDEIKEKYGKKYYNMLRRYISKIKYNDEIKREFLDTASNIFSNGYNKDFLKNLYNILNKSYKYKIKDESVFEILKSFKEIGEEYYERIRKNEILNTYYNYIHQYLDKIKNKPNYIKEIKNSFEYMISKYGYEKTNNVINGLKFIKIINENIFLDFLENKKYMKIDEIEVYNAMGKFFTLKLLYPRVE